MDYVEKAKAFIDRIFPYISASNNVDDTNDMIGYYNLTYHTNVKCSCGSTRIVILYDDFAIKYDIYEEPTEEIKSFGCCADEYAAYQYVRKSEYEYLFAPITEYYYRYGWTFYIMPRIHHVGQIKAYAYEHTTPEETKFLRAHFFDLHEWNYGWKDGHIVIIDYACWQE